MIFSNNEPMLELHWNLCSESYHALEIGLVFEVETRSKFVTDRQTNSLTPYICVCGFFLQVQFATSLLASLAGGQYLKKVVKKADQIKIVKTKCKKLLI